MKLTVISSNHQTPPWLSSQKDDVEWIDLNKSPNFSLEEAKGEWIYICKYNKLLSDDFLSYLHDEADILIFEKKKSSTSSHAYTIENANIDNFPNFILFSPEQIFYKKKFLIISNIIDFRYPEKMLSLSSLSNPNISYFPQSFSFSHCNYNINQLCCDFNYSRKVIKNKRIEKLLYVKFITILYEKIQEVEGLYKITDEAQLSFIKITEALKKYDEKALTDIANSIDYSLWNISEFQIFLRLVTERFSLDELINLSGYLQDNRAKISLLSCLNDKETKNFSLVARSLLHVEPTESMDNIENLLKDIFAQFNRIIIHKGFTKCASTSFQNFCNDENAALLDKGVVFPKFLTRFHASRRASGHGELFYSLNNLYLGKSSEKELNMLQAFCSILTKIPNKDTLLLSSENLAYQPQLLSTEYNHFLETLFNSPQIVFITREKSSWLQSMYAEEITTPFSMVSGDIYDYEAILDARNILDFEEVIKEQKSYHKKISIYDISEMDNFLSSIHPDIPALFKEKSQKDNQSVYYDYLEVFRGIKKIPMGQQDRFKMIFNLRSYIDNKDYSDFFSNINPDFDDLLLEENIFDVQSEVESLNTKLPITKDLYFMLIANISHIILKEQNKVVKANKQRDNAKSKITQLEKDNNTYINNINSLKKLNKKLSNEIEDLRNHKNKPTGIKNLFARLSVFFVSKSRSIK